MDCSSRSYSSSDNSSERLSFLLEQAAGLNEDGVYELSSGKPQEAIPLFQEAWESLMEVAGATGSTCTSSIVGTDCSTAATTTRIQIPHLEDDVFYIYSCAVAYSASTSTTPVNTTSKDVQFECAIVLFNLALAFHQQGKKTKKEGFLRRALQYYQQCQQSLQQVLTTNTTCTAHDELILLTLAVMNNQASIEYELPIPTTTNTTSAANNDNSEKLWHYSIHAILDEETTNFSMVEQSQIHEFVQNAMVFRLQRPCAAPTA
ncbi:expressed unknown protein [Seminavis robusta]|uniref:BRO1 domain-containing protein n=1 Tax=Seminavis robusta TaxID=568900 RepID=A0A9N8DBH0_9STRA|nr:expressed unknown protein [Seminavis robusta]|eukprot:Sro76_g041560.1 n/a (261) ;mRNA; f:40982-41764